MLIHEILKFNMSCSSKKVKRSTKISGCYMTDHHHQSDLILNTNKLTEVHINISHRNVFDAPPKSVATRPNVVCVRFF